MSTLINNNERTFSLSSLLPYDTTTKKNKQIMTALHEYSLLLTVTEQAVDALERGNFEQFDPLVGENMCQIRAIKIAMVAANLLKTIQALKVRLATVKERVNAISEFVPAPKGSLKELLEKEQLDVMLTANEVFLAQSYLLTIVKLSKPSKAETPLLGNDATEPKNLQKLGKVSGSFAHALVKEIRHRLSSDSVEFVRECRRMLPESQELISLVTEELVIEHNGCKSLPFFFVNDILMRQVLVSKIPIVICVDQVANDQDNRKVREICFLFKPTLGSYQRKIIPSLQDLSLPAFILHGSMLRPFSKLSNQAETKTEFLNQSIVDLVLMNSASHRQCLDPSKDGLVQIVGGRRFASYKADAIKMGCSLDNPSLFFVDHAFCALIGHQNLLKRKVDIATALASCKRDLPMSIIGKIVEYEEEA